MYRLAVIAQLVIILVMVGVAILSPDRFQDLTNEDSVIEWLTALLFMAGGVVAGIAAARSRRHRIPRLTIAGLLLLCLALLVVGFEEISWGQRLLAIETPDGLREINMQEEFNLHNIDTGLTQKAAILGSFVVGVCLPTLCLLLAPIRRLYETRLTLRSPSPLVAALCLLGYALCSPDWLLPDLVIGLSYACCGACLAARIAPDRRDRSWPDALVLVAGIVGALGLRVALEVAGPWHNGWMELGEQCFALAAAMLAYGTLSAPANR